MQARACEGRHKGPAPLPNDRKKTREVIDLQKIYFDNGSTSFPKAPGVGDAIKNIIEQGAYNINRGGYEGAYAVADMVLDTREQLCGLFHFSESRNVVFTPSITYSLNYIIKGLLKPGDHVIVSSMEHNGLMRPLAQMAKQGVAFDAAQAACDGTLDPQRVEELIRPNTRAVLMLHASNLCGTMLPIREVGEICARHGLVFVVDSAQTAGVFPIDMEQMHIDVLCFTGHKGLRGPQGTGGFLIRDELVHQVTPLISGGTGSRSDSEEVPDFMPDRFESGTMNLPGIAGLHAALGYLQRTGIDTIARQELIVCQKFIDGALTLPKTRVVGRLDTQNRAAIVSLDFQEMDNAEVSFLLDSEYGVMTRCGLHCAPRAHKTLGTFPQGTVRFSFSHHNTPDEVDVCIEGLRKILTAK